jgi:hypothetical protein
MELETTTTVPVDNRLMKGDLSLLHKRSFAVGIDVGQAHDPTAICIASKIVTTTFNPMFAPYNPFPRPRYEVSHLERLRLGMPYPQQVDRLEALLGRSPLDRLRPRVLVDYTGVGRPVFDMFAGRAGLRRAQGVVITGGRETSSTRAGWSVHKGELVSKLQALLHAGDLRIAASLPDAAVLARELQDFRVRFTENGNATFNAREGAHDDLVLALALAVFGLSRPEPVTDVEVIRAR